MGRVENGGCLAKVCLRVLVGVGGDWVHRCGEREWVVTMVATVCTSLCARWQNNKLECLNCQVGLGRSRSFSDVIHDVVEVQRAVRLVRSVATGRKITNVVTVEDTIVFCDVDHNQFVRGGVCQCFGSR